MPPDGQIQVPGYWSEQELHGRFLPAYGYASYSIQLHTPAVTEPITVFIPDFGSAYRVFIDGELISESGIVSKNLNEIYTTPKTTLHHTTLTEGYHTLVIETATTRFSGLYKAPVLMSYEKAVQQNSDRNAVRFILFGTILFSFLTLTVVYVLSFRIGVRSVWLLSLMSCVLLRLMLLSEFFSFWQQLVFLGLSFESTNDFLFIISFALKFLMIFVYQEQFGIRFSTKEKTFFVLYYISIFLVHLLTPHDIYNRYLDVIIPAASFLIEIYGFCKVYFSKRTLQPYALLVYWGTIIAAGGLVVDSYYANGNIYPNVSLVLPFCICIYLVLLSFAYILRMMKSYREYEQSAVRLEATKNQIAMQTEYYDVLSAQINEVRSIRHDIRHFAATLGLLAEEERYDALKRLVSEYTEIAVMEPLPVFCENVVANSILGYYALRMKQRQIVFQCSCAIPKTLSVQDSDLCIVLSNGLENTMEACEKIPAEKERFVTVEAKVIQNHF